MDYPKCWLILVTPANGDPPWFRQQVFDDRESAQIFCDRLKDVDVHRFHKYRPVQMVPVSKGGES